MREKIYPMYESYNQAAAQLLELIEARDLLAKALKIAPPGKIRDGRRMLADADKKIEACEKALAAEYEAHQKKCRAEDALAETTAEVLNRMEMIYIYFKHHLPTKLDEVKAAIFNGWNSEDIEAFYDRVAILEATELEKIIAESDDS